VALPFPLRDGSGNLLLAANQKITSETQLTSLSTLELFTGETEAAEWRRRVAEKVNGLLIGGATLNAIAEALPDQKITVAAHDSHEHPFTVELDTLLLQLDGALRQAAPGSNWPGRFAQLAGALQQLTCCRFDSTVYTLVQHASSRLERYSAHHALLVASVAAETARLMEWKTQEIDSLFSACLSMNIAMTREQDMLLMQTGPLTPLQRELVREHAVRGALVLKAAGVKDLVWLDAVARHHLVEPPVPLVARTPGQRLAALIRRVDIFGAKLSSRASRAPMSPIQAAREACLGQDGAPDEIGGVLLRAIGLYPPGSFVQLESGELGVVIARGSRANLPIVAALVGRSGLPLAEPAVRDTLDKRYAVNGAVLPSAVKVRPPHKRLLEMIRLRRPYRPADRGTPDA
jgi:HD-GYP domain-containing protein (c-di-GMP phosphodiesterase class II)